MSQERSARVRAAILVRVLRALLLAAALVCGSAPVGAGQAGWGLIVFEAGGAIYVVEAGGGTPVEIVGNKGGVVNMQPALSPDGSRVAFSSKRDGKFSIYIVGVDGEGLRRVTDGPDHDSEPAWSPDGSRLAFVRGFDPTGSDVVVIACEIPAEIMVVSVDEGVDGQRPTEVSLTSGTDPAWSPDGLRIAFTSNRDDYYNFDIYTMSSADGGDVHRLTQGESQEADPAWSPDGSRIAYTGNMRINLGTQCGNMPIVGDDDKDEEEEGDPLMAALGPSVYRMMADGSEQKNVTDAGYAVEPDWSPDGSRIVFVGHRKGEDVNLYLIAWDGVGPWINLTFDPAEESSPSWADTIVR